MTFSSTSKNSSLRYIHQNESFFSWMEKSSDFKVSLTPLFIIALGVFGLLASLAFRREQQNHNSNENTNIEATKIPTLTINTLQLRTQKTTVSYLKSSPQPTTTTNKHKQKVKLEKIYKKPQNFLRYIV